MKFVEKFSGVFLIAGLFLLIGAMLSLGIVPAIMVDRLNPRQGLPEAVPPDMHAHYASVALYQAALLRGRDVYVAEGCWHCHSQYVRPVGNEALRYGPVTTPGEYQTVLQQPQLLGTRRVGPDLSRESGKKSNDWHWAHLYEPRNVVPDSVMPGYAWLFEKAKDVITPKSDAIALVAYLQHLGAPFGQMSDSGESPEMPPTE